MFRVFRHEKISKSLQHSVAFSLPPSLCGTGGKGEAKLSVEKEESTRQVIVPTHVTPPTEEPLSDLVVSDTASRYAVSDLPVEPQSQEKPVPSILIPAFRLMNSRLFKGSEVSFVIRGNLVDDR
jgi:hypothetical protein